MKFDIYLEKKEIKIIHFKKVIYSKKFDLEKLLCDLINVYLESSKDKKENSIQDFLVCYLKGDTNPPRSLQEKEETTLDHFVVFHPKSINGIFPSEILNYSRRKLETLFNLVHSKNEYVRYRVLIGNKETLIVNVQCAFPGQIYITSDYFKNVDNIIINICYFG